MLVLVMAFPVSAGGTHVQGDTDGNGVVNMDDLTNMIIYLVFGKWSELQVPPGCVDLGLPSQTMWATCNLGATNPEDYGDYYAWADLVPNKEYYWWETTAWTYGENGHLYFTKYNTDSQYGEVDNKMELDPEDDVAYVNLGSDWRMPSREQIGELVENCTWEWTEVNGVYGQMVTGPNGNTMFLPAAGRRLAYNLNDVGSYGYYWGREIYAQTPAVIHPTKGVMLYIGSQTFENSASDRDFGQSVRPVNVSQLLHPGTYFQGDADGNGVVNMDDLTALINYLVFGVWPEIGDTYVDLGLPTGTLWATRNVGATYPEDSGDYFAWGETTPNKDSYIWATYQWGAIINGSSKITKYNTKETYGEVDNLTELEPEDDAAYVNMGPEWRMPSKEQIDELVENCTWEWTEVNGVYGQLVTGPNGNTMFLPAAGNNSGNHISDAGTYGHYWSRDLQFLTPTYIVPLNATKLFISSDNYGKNAGQRSAGFTVRAVRVSE